MQIKGRIIIPGNRDNILTIAELDGLGKVNINKNLVICDKEVLPLQSSIFIILC